MQHNPEHNNAGFVQHWRRVGPLLERIRREEQRQFQFEENRELIDALLEIGYQHRKPQPTSGLVEQQRRFQKMFKKKQ